MVLDVAISSSILVSRYFSLIKMCVAEIGYQIECAEINVCQVECAEIDMSIFSKMTLI